MRRFIVPTLLLSALLLTPLLDPARADAGTAALPGLALLDFNYVDTSGETRDQTAEHQKRLDAFMAALRKDVLASQKYQMVIPTCRPIPCQVGQSALVELQDAARAAGAKFLMMGGVHKMSTLIQNARVMAVDLQTNAVVLDKLVTFRGDTDEAWQRAETFIAEQITTANRR